MPEIKTRLAALLTAAALALFADAAVAQSPNLGCDHIPSNPTQGEITANEATNCLDEAGNEARSWTITGNTTVTQAQLAEGVLHVLGGTPSAFNFDLPSGVERFFAVQNASGATATVQVTGGGGDSVEVEDGDTFLLHSDGTDVVSIGGGGSGDVTVGTFFGGQPTAGATLLTYQFALASTCPQNLTGSVGRAETAADSEAVFDLAKNGSSIGSVTFAASGSTASFTHASATSFAAGDWLSIVAPSPQDATLADVSITLLCERS